MFKIKVQGGTSKGDEDLCRTCYSVSLYKNEANKEFKYCNALDRDMPHKIIECNSYHRYGQPYLSDMRLIAWHITPEVKEKIGFKDPEVNIKVTKPGDKENKYDHYSSDGLGES